MEKIEQLQPGKFYHIYNCGINGEDLFRESKDYERFLRLFEKFIAPVCDIYAWVLMKNHFHSLVKIKENITYKYSLEEVGNDKEKFKEVKWETVEICEKGNLSASAGPDSVKRTKVKTLNPTPHLHFSHFFNAYAKYYNIKYDRHGSLFERPFHRKEIDNIKYFRNLVIYIHQNPVHHGFCDHPLEYGWSSYLTCISLKPTMVKREEVIGWFDDLAQFKNKHNEVLKRKELEYYLEFKQPF